MFVPQNLRSCISALSLGEQQTGNTGGHSNSCRGSETSNSSFFHFSLVLLFLGFNTGQMKFLCQPTFGMGSQNVLATELEVEKGRNQFSEKNIM
jgi:hypothetical protein